MPESFIRIDVYYRPNLKYYPDHCKTVVDAMEEDIKSIKDFEMVLDEFLEVADRIEHSVVIQGTQADLDDDGALKKNEITTHSDVERTDGEGA